MRHWRARRRIVAWLDDQLCTDEAKHVEAHVARCPRCRRTVAEHEICAGLVRRVPRSLVPERWSVAVDLRLRAIAGLPSPAVSAAANGLALRAAAATATMAVMLVLVTVGPLSVRERHRGQWSGMLPSAEKQSTLVAARFEPPGGWGRN